MSGTGVPNHHETARDNEFRISYSLQGSKQAKLVGYIESGMRQGANLRFGGNRIRDAGYFIQRPYSLTFGMT